MTMRCSRCDIAHDDTGRCPTELEYERGYREGIDQAKKTVATVEAECATDLANLAAWVVRNLHKFGCFTGDCPHWDYTECIQAIVNNYEADEAANAGGGQ